MIKGTLDTGSASIPEHVVCLLAVKHAVLEAWDGFPFSPPVPRKTVPRRSAGKSCTSAATPTALWVLSGMLRWFLCGPLQPLGELSEARPYLNYPQLLLQCLAWGMETIRLGDI